MSETLYACTYISKEAEEDDYEKGRVGGGTCILSESASITADTLAGLIKKIGKYYCLELDDLFIPGGEDDEGVTHIGYNRLETNDCDEPSEHEKELWKKGELKLYLADYTFAIEKRVVEDVKLSEFEAEGIKFH